MEANIEAPHCKSVEDASNSGTQGQGGWVGGLPLQRGKWQIAKILSFLSGLPLNKDFVYAGFDPVSMLQCE